MSKIDDDVVNLISGNILYEKIGLRLSEYDLIMNTFNSVKTITIENHAKYTSNETGILLSDLFTLVIWGILNCLQDSEGTHFYLCLDDEAKKIKREIALCQLVK